MGCGVDKHAVAATSYDVLLGEATLTEALRWIEKAQMQLLPANGDLTAAEVSLLKTDNAPTVCATHACSGGVELRCDSDRLSAVAEHADRQCLDRRSVDHCPRSMRILRAGGLVGAARYH